MKTMRCHWCDTRLYKPSPVMSNPGMNSRPGRLRWHICEDCTRMLEQIIEAIPVAVVRKLIATHDRREKVAS